MKIEIHLFLFYFYENLVTKNIKNCINFLKETRQANLCKVDTIITFYVFIRLGVFYFLIIYILFHDFGEKSLF